MQVMRCGLSLLGRGPRRRAHARLAAAVAICCAGALAISAPAFAANATYSATETIPVPPASNFAGSGGGDGWSVALSSSQVFNVFHHDSVLQVACHNQSDASNCWPNVPTTIVDGSGNNFATSGHPGMYLNQGSGKLYVYATRSSDSTAGVVCVDVSNPTANPTFCGFTALSAVGEGWYTGIGELSNPMQVGTKLYAFNYVSGASASGGAGRTENTMLCFDLTTFAACAGQPYAVNIGAGSVSVGTFPSPATAAIGSQLIVPVNTGGSNLLGCLDASTLANCSGSWPVSSPVGTGSYGSPDPMLDATGKLTGLCLPTGSDPCFGLDGSAATTPAGLPGALSSGSSASWDGPGLVLGPRVYIPEWGNVVACFDYSTGASCGGGFPKSFSNLGLLYTVSPDPQRPSCIWVNSDNGSAQIQNFDAYTGGACGQGSLRVLASQFVVNKPLCVPASYTSLQITQPAANTYKPTTSTIEFDDGDANKITTISPNPQFLDATGSVSLVGDSLNTATGLPQFLITLNGVSGTPSSVVVKLTWTGTYDASCVGPGTTVTAPDNDLGITGVPANITTDATGPSGATVAYTAPTATDESGDTPAATVSCDHASGSAFPIGTTTVTCTATDADDANSPVSATFTVRVKGALAQLTDLKAYVTGIGPGTSLADKVQAAINYLQAGDTADTCSQLGALINEAKAQSGKHLTAAEATAIITAATRIRAVLGC